MYTILWNVRFVAHSIMVLMLPVRCIRARCLLPSACDGYDPLTPDPGDQVPSSGLD